MIGLIIKIKFICFVFVAIAICIVVNNFVEQHMNVCLVILFTFCILLLSIMVVSRLLHHLVVNWGNIVTKYCKNCTVETIIVTFTCVHIDAVDLESSCVWLTLKQFRSDWNCVVVYFVKMRKQAAKVEEKSYAWFCSMTTYLLKARTH